MDIILWVALAIITLVIGYQMGFSKGRAEGMKLGRRKQKVVHSLSDKSFKYEKSYLGKYLCFTVDPINTVFLVSEEYFHEKLEKDMRIGILRYATEEEVRQAMQSRLIG